MDLMSLVIKIGADVNGATEGIDKVKSAMQGAEGKAEGFKVKLVNVFKTVATAAVVKTAVQNIYKLGKAAYDSYAEYEQLAGGVETLFKTSSDTVKKYADEAYKTAGLSANEYMSTVTSFSAAMIQSLGGDTAKAAKLSNQAIIDMADNANKMGSSMESIQTAYQGFSKQNYTMLDNLKLGYGGTKSEMERLILDAEKMDKTFSVTHTKTKDGADQISYSYADIVKAIHIVQTNMGITGTTAKEASETIQGSIASTKAAFSNLILAIGKGSGVKDAVKNVVSSAKDVVRNSLTAIKRIWKGFKDVAKVVGGMIIDGLKTAFQNAVNKLSTYVGPIKSAFKALLSNVFKSLKIDTSAIKNFISGLFDSSAVKSAISNFSLAFQMVKEVIDDVKVRLEFVISTFKNLVSAAISFVKGDFTFDNLKTAWNNFVQAVKAVNWHAIIDVLVDGFKRAFTQIASIDWAGLGTTIWDAIKTAFSATANWFKDKFDYVKTKVESVKWAELGTNIWNGIKGAFSAVGSWFMQRFESVKLFVLKINWAQLGTDIWNAIKSAFLAIGSWLKERFDTAKNFVLQVDWSGVGTSMWNAIKSAFTTIGSWMKERFDAAKNFVLKIDWAQLGTDIWGGIKTAFFTIGSWLKERFETAKNFVLQVDWNGLGTSIGDTIKGALDTVKSWLPESFQTAIDTVSTFFTTTVPQFISTAMTWFTALRYGVLNPLGEYIGGKFIDAWTAIKDYWENDLSPRLQGLKDAFDVFRTNVLQPIATFLTDTFKKAWEGVQSLFGGGGEGDGVTGSVKELSRSFHDFWLIYLKPIADWVSGTWSTVWDTFTGVLDGVIQFLTGAFSGNWDDAWNGLVKAFGSIFDGIKDLVKAPLNAIIGALNGLISKVELTINRLVRGINGAMTISIPRFAWDFRNPFTGNVIGSIGFPGYNWAPHLSGVTFGRIPALANGGILGNGGHAIVGEAGPEYLRVVNGKAIVTPTTGAANGGTTNNTINIYQQPGEDPELLAERVQRVLARQERQRRTIYA